MRILYFAPRKCWPLNNGARLRDYHLASQLARHAEVTYLGLCYPEEEQFASNDVGLPVPEKVFERVITMPKASPYGPVNLLKGLVGGTPVTVLNWTNADAAKDIAALGQEGRFDAIHLVGVHLLRYMPVLRQFPGRPPVVCDWHDIQSEKMWRYCETIGSRLRRFYAGRTARLLENAERELLATCEAHTVVSTRDRAKLEAWAPAGPVHVIENGVDTAYFARESRPARESAGNLLFVGAMDYNANEDAVTWFAGNVWQHVLQRFPAMRFTIVGRKPTPLVQALAQQPGIDVTGTVADVRPYYDDAMTMVVPLHWGSGTRLKILEAMAAGVPVVSTALGAEGLDAKHGEEILIADSADDMLAAIIRLHEEAGLREKLIAGGLRLAKATYDWAIPGQRLYGICERLTAGRQPA